MVKGGGVQFEILIKCAPLTSYLDPPLHADYISFHTTLLMDSGVLFLITVYYAPSGRGYITLAYDNDNRRTMLPGDGVITHSQGTGLYHTRLC